MYASAWNLVTYERLELLRFWFMLDNWGYFIYASTILFLQQSIWLGNNPDICMHHAQLVAYI